MSRPGGERAVVDGERLAEDRMLRGAGRTAERSHDDGGEHGRSHGPPSTADGTAVLPLSI